MFKIYTEFLSLKFILSSLQAIVSLVYFYSLTAKKFVMNYAHRALSDISN